MVAVVVVIVVVVVVFENVCEIVVILKHTYRLQYFICIQAYPFLLFCFMNSVL
jgi:hypothetical protein